VVADELEPAAVIASELNSFFGFPVKPGFKAGPHGDGEMVRAQVVARWRKRTRRHEVAKRLTGSPFDAVGRVRRRRAQLSSVQAAFSS